MEEGKLGVGGHIRLGKYVNGHFDRHTMKVLEREHCICLNITVTNSVSTKQTLLQILMGPFTSHQYEDLYYWSSDDPLTVFDTLIVQNYLPYLLKSYIKYSGELE